jgi:hypothetical protein
MKFGETTELIELHLRATRILSMIRRNLFEIRTIKVFEKVNQRSAILFRHNEKLEHMHDSVINKLVKASMELRMPELKQIK